MATSSAAFNGQSQARKPNPMHVFRQVLVLVAVLAAIAGNYWAQAASPNGETHASVSYSLYTYLQPATFAFGIWVPVYLGTVLMAVYQLFPHRRAGRHWQQFGWALIGASACNGAFSFLYLNREIDWAWASVAGLFACTFALYALVRRHPCYRTGAGLAMVGWPARLYFGWAAVALSAATAQVLLFAGWRSLGLDATLAAIAVLAVLAVVGVLLVVRLHDYVAPGVVVWGTASIAAEQVENKAVMLSAAGAALFVAVAMLAKVVASRRRTQTPLRA